MNHIYQVEYNLEYIGGDKIDAIPILKLFCRDDNGVKSIKNIKNLRPYIYVEHGKELPNTAKKYIVSKDDYVYDTILGEKCIKVTSQNPKNIPLLRDILNINNIKTYEDDVLFTIRMIIDHKNKLEKMGYDFKSANVLRKLYLDIETTTKYEKIDLLNVPEEITTIGCYDTHTKKYTIFIFHETIPITYQPNSGVIIKAFTKEVDMLNAFIGWFRDINPDMILGWNLNQFDLPYIIRRTKKLKINPNNLAVNGGTVAVYMSENEKWSSPKISGLILFDLLDFYRKVNLNQITSYSLNNVALSELGYGKEDIRNVGDAWTKDPNKIIPYNIRDIELCVKIDEKRELVNFIDGIRDIVGCNFDDFSYFSRLIDIITLRFAHERNIILPSKRRVNEPWVSKDKRDSTYEGAFVFALPGLHDNVCALDLKTLYPLIIKTMNISYETLTDETENVIKIGETKYKKKKGIMPQIIDHLLDISSGYKKLRNEAPYDSEEYKKYANLYECAKFIVCTFYGVQALPTYRLYNIKNAESITRVGRTLIQFTKKIIEDEGHTVVIVDTDSCYVALSNKIKDSEKCIEEGLRITDLLNKKYNEFIATYNVSEHFFQIKFEKYYEKMLVGKKKRYAGIIKWKEGQADNAFNVVGFEIVRSSTPKITKDIQENVLKKIMNGKTYNDIKKYLKDESIKIKNEKYLPSEIAFPTALNQSYYATNLPKVRGLKWSNTHLKTTFKSGDKPLMLYVTDAKNNTDTILFEFDYQVDTAKKIGIEIDYIKMIEKIVFKPLYTIFEALNWDPKETWKSIKPILDGQQTL